MVCPKCQEWMSYTTAQASFDVEFVCLSCKIICNEEGQTWDVPVLGEPTHDYYIYTCGECHCEMHLMLDASQPPEKSPFGWRCPACGNVSGLDGEVLDPKYEELAKLAERYAKEKEQCSAVI